MASCCQVRQAQALSIGDIMTKYSVIVTGRADDRMLTREIEALRFEVTPLGALVFYSEHVSSAIAYPIEAIAPGRWLQVGVASESE